MAKSLIVPFDRLGTLLPFDRLPFDRLPFDRLPFDRLPFDRLPFDKLRIYDRIYEQDSISYCKIQVSAGFRGQQAEENISAGRRGRSSPVLGDIFPIKTEDFTGGGVFFSRFRNR